jgi:hypothetical protein
VLAAALSECWSETAAQRCLVHLQRNARIYLTGRPRTEAGKALLRLGRALTRIHAPAEAAAWLAGLHDRHQQHGDLVKARTYRSTTATVPGWVRANQSWWYTHDRLRKAYRLLERLGQAGTLSPTSKANTPGWTSPRQQTGSKAERMPSPGSCCGDTGA